MAFDGTAAPDHGRWDHPAPSVCDRACIPSSGTRELWHTRTPEVTVLPRHGDTISGAAFRDDAISPAGIQTPGEVGWRLQVNDEIVEASLEDMERVLADQLSRVRQTIDALARVPRQPCSV